MTYFHWLFQSPPSQANKSLQFPSRRGRQLIFLRPPTTGESEFTLYEQVTEQENSLPNVWGEDANEWNPDRFLDPQRDFREASSGIGVFGNVWVYVHLNCA